MSVDSPISGGQEPIVGAPPAGELTGLLPSAGIRARAVWLKIESAVFFSSGGVNVDRDPAWQDWGTYHRDLSRLRARIKGGPPWREQR